MIDLPASVSSRVEMKPFEDVGLAVLRDAFPDIKVVSLIPNDAQTDNDILVLVRRASGWGTWNGDTRFVDEGALSVQVFTAGDDADERGALVSEAIRVAFRDAWRAHRPTYYPGIGSLIRVDMLEEPVRKADWATASGPVQYADLPEGWFRYETIYSLRVRKPMRSWDTQAING